MTTPNELTKHYVLKGDLILGELMVEHGAGNHPDFTPVYLASDVEEKLQEHNALLTDYKNLQQRCAELEARLGQEPYKFPDHTQP